MDSFETYKTFPRCKVTEFERKVDVQNHEFGWACFQNRFFSNLLNNDAQTKDLQIFKQFDMSQMNPNEFVYNTASSVQLPYKAGLSL